MRVLLTDSKGILLLLATLALLTARAEAQSSPAYIPPTVLSLIVSGQDKGHLIDMLNKLKEIEQRNVRVGNVYVIGLNLESVKPTKRMARSAQAKKQETTTWTDAGRRTVGSYYSLLEQMGIPHFQLKLRRQLLDGLKINYSPTWIVRHLGKDYIFEGHLEPQRLFNRRGDFLAGN